MPWFKVDDGFFSSKPVLRLPRRYRAQSVGLWLLAGTWSAQEELDGFVPEYVLSELCGTPSLAAQLVSVGLWENVDRASSERGISGWRFRNWGKYQPTKAELDENREKERIRKANWRASHRDTTGTGAGVTPGHQGVSHPSRPDPTRPDPNTSPNGDVDTPRKRGTRLDASWQPSRELIEQMRAELPHVNLQAEHRQFVDYWIAQPGQKGVKTDWPATWRNWMRRAAERTTGQIKITAAQRNLAVVERFAAREADQQQLEA